MNTTQTIASISGALVVGLIAGYFLRPQQDIDCSKCPPPCASSSKFIDLELDNAYDISVNYRKTMGYCDDVSNSHPNEGYFDISNDGLVALNSAVETIKRKTQGAGQTSPDVFRCIHTLDNEGDSYSKMVVVGLDNTTRKENTSYIEKIEIDLPCPYLCDAPLSEIIFGPNGDRSCTK